jgi:hypothetical protein
MKYGLRIINNSPVVDKGGVVYVYTASQRVITAAKLTLMTCDQLDDMFDDIIAMNGAQPYGAEAFTGQGCAWHGYPTDSTTYEEFDAWNGQMNKAGQLEVADGFAEHWSLTPGVTDVKPRGISTTFVCFEAPSRAQLYTLNYRAAWYTRWPLGTVLGQNMPHIPDANPAGSNAHRKKAQDTGGIDPAHSGPGIVHNPAAQNAISHYDPMDQVLRRMDQGNRVLEGIGRAGAQIPAVRQAYRNLRQMGVPAARAEEVAEEMAILGA